LMKGLQAKLINGHTHRYSHTHTDLDDSLDQPDVFFSHGQGSVACQVH